MCEKNAVKKENTVKEMRLQDEEIEIEVTELKEWWSPKSQWT